MVGSRSEFLKKPNKKKAPSGLWLVEILLRDRVKPRAANSGSIDVPRGNSEGTPSYRSNPSEGPKCQSVLGVNNKIKKHKSKSTRSRVSELPRERCRHSLFCRTGTMLLFGCLDPIDPNSKTPRVPSRTRVRPFGVVSLFGLSVGQAGWRGLARLVGFRATGYTCHTRPKQIALQSLQAQCELLRSAMGPLSSPKRRSGTLVPCCLLLSAEFRKARMP